jgi:hypothetical protein
MDVTKKYEFTNFKSEESGEITFQPVKFYEMNEDGSYQNGTTIEELLRVSRERLVELSNKFPSRENSLAVTKIQEAEMWLEARTKDRIARGVEGKHLA